MKTKRVQKWLGVALLCAVCLSLTGCGNEHEHEWKDATCTTPKTCVTCDETEGEALGHTWTEATCDTPKTCSVCGETEGEALGHTLTEANYQKAPVCEVCGVTVGEPLQADYEKYGVTYVTELDKEYPFVTQCSDSDNLTNGKVIFSDYRTFESDDEHEAKEGYEWQTVTLTLVFDDENAFEYGVGGYSFVSGEFYDNALFYGEEDESETDNEDDNAEIHTVNYNGEDYTECLYEEEELEIPEAVQGYWIERDDGTAYYKNAYRVFFRCPVGYDGNIISVMDLETNEKIEEKTGGMIDSIEDAMIYLESENTITFRLKQ